MTGRSRASTKSLTQVDYLGSNLRYKMKRITWFTEGKNSTVVVVKELGMILRQEAQRVDDVLTCDGSSETKEGDEMHL